MSLSKASRRLGCSKSTIGRILKCFRKPILCYKRKKRPSRTPEQRLWGRRKCSRLYSKYRNHELIIDNESYFTLSNSTLAGNNTYYSNDQKLTPDIVKYYDVAKFEKKLLVWMAISPRGITSIYIGPSGQAVNQEIYLKECLQKRLQPFINKYYRDTKYIFWPDLATSQYANSVTKWLKTQKIPFVQKKDNPAN